MRKEKVGLADQETFGLVYFKGSVVALMNCVAVVIDRSGHTQNVFETRHTCF